MMPSYEDARRFETRAKKLVEQYSNYQALPGLKVNGALTVGENIPDLGGVLMALDAYHKSLGGRPAPVIGGLTGDQRFCLSWLPHVDQWYEAFGVNKQDTLHRSSEERVRIW